MRAIILVIILAFACPQSPAQDTTLVKSWAFALKHGSLKIELRETKDGTFGLGFGPDGQNPEAPLEEQIIPLKNVIADMPKFGFDTKKIVYIGTRLYNRQLLIAVAHACADSSDWRKSVRGNRAGLTFTLVRVMNQKNIFHVYQEVLRDIGLDVRVSSVENLGLVKFSTLLRNDGDIKDGDLLIPGDAMISMTVVARPNSTQ